MLHELDQKSIGSKDWIPRFGIAHELQPKFRVMESSIRAVSILSIFFEIEFGLGKRYIIHSSKNDDMFLLYTKTRKMVIHSSKSDDLEFFLPNMTTVAHWSVQRTDLWIFLCCFTGSHEFTIGLQDLLSWILRDFDQEKIGVSGNFKSLILRIHGSSLLLISGLHASSNHVKPRVVDSLGGPYRGPKNQKFVVLREVGPIRFARAKAWIYAIASWVL